MAGSAVPRPHRAELVNVAGLQIPVRGRLLGYMRNTNQPAGPLLLDFTHHFEITNLVVGMTPKSFVPKPTLATRVLDFRAGDDPRRPIEYLSTNGVIISDPDDAWKTMEGQREEARREREKRRQLRAEPQF